MWCASSSGLWRSVSTLHHHMRRRLAGGLEIRCDHPHRYYHHHQPSSSAPSFPSSTITTMTEGGGRLLSFPLSCAGCGLVHRCEKAYREDPAEFLAARVADPASRMVICHCDKKEDPKVFIAPSPLHSLSQLRPGAESALWFLGEDVAGRSLFSAPISSVKESYLEPLPPSCAASPAGVSGGGGGQWVQARQLFAWLPPDELNAIGTALAMDQWRSSQRYCSYCGAAILPEHFVQDHLVCGGCQRQAYPAVGAAVIVAVLDGKGQVLLCQNKNRPLDFQGRTLRTILAGFVSPGESLEEAVVREVLEESGAALTRLTYAGSQPWPFPSPMMMACYYGVADSTKPLQVEEEELCNVQWVPREEVIQAFALSAAAGIAKPGPLSSSSSSSSLPPPSSSGTTTFALPPKYTASHTLLKAWVEGRVDDWGHPVVLSS